MHSPRPVSAENTLRGWTAGALYHNPARCAIMRQSEQIARVNAPKSARKATSTLIVPMPRRKPRHFFSGSDAFTSAMVRLLSRATQSDTIMHCVSMVI